MRKTKIAVENLAELTIRQINNLDFEDEKLFIEKKNKKPLAFSTKISNRSFGRGNPLLARRKITSIESIDKRLDELIKKCQ
ncbi:hypothetical protein CWE04_11880 [Thomasclavelia cocleata]|uniref:Uncharacterized protein n=1 Tax=Thomasclavelia cocleata TaxID=69824 RepID=A0A1I0BKU1_9FIRM|nr:hypothetical protein [Thomasclavelia cocleata]MCR1960197.1 hypothetical protein [Thomasclavelia cocleata]NDO41829.1 hypothetical protein [Thomasclavelia cocleata]PJN79901.1 hypothetical protein CWE04_11880 [Thomasclavelia cocleata]SET07605.1 hypothetical protein SAMN04489758_101168 [Thomasclavelia cocleata]